MKIILTGGGTGGHVLPAVALAEKIRDKYPEANILFIGRAGGDENRTVREAKIPLAELKVQGIERKFTPKNLKSVLLALNAIDKAKRIIKDFEPDAVIGTGGYVCWPVLFAAHKLRVKAFIHESNVYPGLVTRLSSKRCDGVFLNHEETKKYLKDDTRTYTVGNPLRKDFFKITKEDARASLGIRKKDVFIVSFGGSGGARVLNDAVLSLMRTYSRKTPNVRHIHATGQKYYDALSENERFDKSGGSKIVPYIDNMPRMLLASDVVICRAGAMTLSEIASSGTAAILIPSPNVTSNHQYKNAMCISDAGGALVLKENDLTADSLCEKVRVLVENEKERQKLSKCLQRFAISNSADRILDVVVSSIKKS